MDVMCPMETMVGVDVAYEKSALVIVKPTTARLFRVNENDSLVQNGDVKNLQQEKGSREHTQWSEREARASPK